MGGYEIEEIDYTLEVFRADIEGTGLVLERAKGFDVFGYYFMLPAIAKHRLIGLIVKPFYLFCRLVENWLPFYLAQKYAYWLFFVARKV